VVERLFRRGHLIVGFVAAFAIVALGHAAPITYDEAFDRLYYGSFPIGQIVRSYDLPNNHIAFTILQSFISTSLLRWDPWTVRIFSDLFGIAAISLLLWGARRRRLGPWFPLLAVAGSPLLVSYLFLARGYTFSAFFLMLGALLPVALRKRATHGLVLGATAFALGTWPLPDFLYAAPGWALGLVAVLGFRRAAVAAAIYAVEVAIAFAPIAGEIHKQSKVAWAGHQAWWPWLGDVLRATDALPVAAWLLAGVAVAVSAWRRGGLGVPRDPAARVAVVAAAMALSWFVLVGVSYAVGIEDLPFVRSTVPALWLVLAAVVAVLPRGRFEFAATAVLLPGAIWAVVVWVLALTGHGWHAVDRTTENQLFYGATPTSIRDVPGHGDRIACTDLDFPTCRIVRWNLARRGVAVTFPGTKYMPDVPCIVGSVRVPPPGQVLVYRGNRIVGAVCE
jgi:hypothetical protein